MGECKESVSPKLDKACIDGDRVESDGEQTSRFRFSVIESRKGSRTQKGKVVEAIVETSKEVTVTERRVRSDVSESHQEEVKKPEEQASVVTQTAEFPDSTPTTVDSLRGKLRSMCARMTTRRKLRWRHYQEGDELAREQFRRFGRKLVRRPSVFSKHVDAQH